ncbi:MAG: SdpI family protein [Alicyclobacillaceae bacterium]|nr:SdpI family protein [Alicyclobacillaceae bacterium]
MNPNNMTPDAHVDRPGSAVPWWGWLAWLACVATSAALYPHLPSVVATHFDAAGRPNGYSPRWLAVSVAPGLTLILLLLWQGLWRIDPKRANYSSFWSTYRLLGGCLAVFMAVTNAWMLTRNLRPALPVQLVPCIVGLFIMFLSNLLPRVQPNWWLGIRTPWTLSSEEAWRKTHRLGGQLGVVAGLVMVVCAWVLPPQAAVYGVLGPLVVWVIVTTLASYLYTR